MKTCNPCHWPRKKIEFEADISQFSYDLNYFDADGFQLELSSNRKYKGAWIKTKFDMRYMRYMGAEIYRLFGDLKPSDRFKITVEKL